jgi:hypothetical protein
MLAEDFPDLLVQLVLLLEFFRDEADRFLEDGGFFFDQDFAVLLEIADDEETQVLDLILVQPHNPLKIQQSGKKFKNHIKKNSDQDQERGEAEGGIPSFGQSDKLSFRAEQAENGLFLPGRRRKKDVLGVGLDHVLRKDGAAVLNKHQPVLGQLDFGKSGEQGFQGFQELCGPAGLG